MGSPGVIQCCSQNSGKKALAVYVPMILSRCSTSESRFRVQIWEVDDKIDSSPVKAFRIATQSHTDDHIFLDATQVHLQSYSRFEVDMLSNLINLPS